MLTLTEAPVANNAVAAARRPVLVFRSELLPYSETFIPALASRLERYRPVYVGMCQRDGIQLPADSTVVLNRKGILGRMRELAFKWSGYDPLFIGRLRAMRPALVHAHFLTDAMFALPIAQQLQVPLVVTVHGYDITSRDHDLRKHRSGRLLVDHRQRLHSAAARFIAVSNYIRDQLVARGAAPEKVVVHYNGVDTARFSESNYAEREPIVLFVGRMVTKKGGEYLIRAMQQVQRELPQARLVLIGAGPKLAELQTLSNDLGVHAEFLGAQSSAVVQSWMQRAWVMCAPSVTAESGDSEGMGVVLLEAQATGLPVIGSLHGGMPEAVLDGETGVVVPERDVANIAAAIAKMFCEPDWHASLSHKAREFVCANFEVTLQAKKLEAIYDSILDD